MRANIILEKEFKIIMNGNPWRIYSSRLLIKTMLEINVEEDAILFNHHVVSMTITNAQNLREMKRKERKETKPAIKPPAVVRRSCCFSFSAKLGTFFLIGSVNSRH